MKNPKLLAALAAVACALCAPVAAQDSAPKNEAPQEKPQAAAPAEGPQQFAIPGHGSISLRVPAGWRSTGTPNAEPPSVTIRLGPSSGAGFVVQLTSLWLDASKRANLTPEGLKAGTLDNAGDMIRESVEKDPAVAELRGPQALAYHVSLTLLDEKAGTRGFKHTMQGMMKTGNVVTIFTFLSQDAGLPAKQDVLKMLEGATWHE
jgi:hypothetical protein